VTGLQVLNTSERSMHVTISYGNISLFKWNSLCMGGGTW
jgi:hypothetical protein